MGLITLIFEKNEINKGFLQALGFSVLEKLAPRLIMKQVMPRPIPGVSPAKFYHISHIIVD